MTCKILKIKKLGKIVVGLAVLLTFGAGTFTSCKSNQLPENANGFASNGIVDSNRKLAAIESKWHITEDIVTETLSCYVDKTWTLDIILNGRHAILDGNFSGDSQKSGSLKMNVTTLTDPEFGTLASNKNLGQFTATINSANTEINLGLSELVINKVSFKGLDIPLPREK